MRTALLAIVTAAAAWAQGVPENLTLRQAEAAALASHPRIQAAKLEARAAEQQTTEVRSGLYPTFFGSLTGAGAPQDTRIGAGALNNPSIYSRFASGFTASQLITDFGRTSHLVSSSRLRAAAEQDTAEATAADVLLAVDRAYFSALRAQSVLRVAKQTVDARQLVADQVSALARSKLKSGLDVSFANVNLAEAKVLLANAQNDVDSAFAELAAAMGETRPRAWDLLDEPLPPAPPADLATVLDTAIRKRPELAGLRANQQAAQEFYRSEKNLWLPSVSAVTSLGFIPGGGPQLPSRYSAAGLNVNVPIFNGHLFGARKQEAELRAEAASERVKDEELAVARDVRVAWFQSQNAWQQMDLTRQLLDQANQALDLAQARYDIGLSSIVELSQAQLAKTSAEISNVTAKYNYELRRAELEYQAGELP